MSILKSKEEVVGEFRIHTIQDAAMRVIARKGIANASMQEIATEAGIAKGTIYLYFQNQQELLDRTVDTALSRLLEGLEEVLDAEGRFPDKLRSFLRAQLEFLDSNQEFFRVLAATKYPAGTQPSRCARTERPQYQAYHRKLSGFLRQAMEAGEIRPLDPERLARFIEEGVLAVLMQRVSEATSPTIEEDVEWMSGVILGGVAAKRGRK